MEWISDALADDVTEWSLCSRFVFYRCKAQRSGFVSERTSNVMEWISDALADDVTEWSL